MAFDLCVLTNEGISSIGLLKNRTHSISDVRVFLFPEKMNGSSLRSFTAEGTLGTLGVEGCVELPCVYSVSQEVNISVTGSRPADGYDAPSGYTVVAVATFVADETETNVALLGCVSDELIIADERLKFTINLEETRDVFTAHADFDGTVVQGILQDNYYTKDEVDALVESSGSSDTDLSDYVTLDTNQTITGTKTFGSSVYVSSSSYFTSLDVTNTTSGKSTQLTSSSLNLSDNLSIRNSYGRVNEAYLNLMTLTASHDTSSNSLGGIDLSNASMSVFFISSTVGTVYGKTTYNIPQDGSLSEMPEGFYGMGAEIRYFSVDSLAAEFHASLDFYLPNPHKIYVHDPANGSVTHSTPYVIESNGSSSSPYSSLHDYISSLVSSSSSSSSDYYPLYDRSVSRSSSEIGAVYPGSHSYSSSEVPHYFHNLNAAGDNAQLVNDGWAYTSSWESSGDLYTDASTGNTYDIGSLDGSSEMYYKQIGEHSTFTTEEILQNYGSTTVAEADITLPVLMRGGSTTAGGTDTTNASATYSYGLFSLTRNAHQYSQYAGWWYMITGMLGDTYVSMFYVSGFSSTHTFNSYLTDPSSAQWSKIPLDDVPMYEGSVTLGADWTSARVGASSYSDDGMEGMNDVGVYYRHVYFSKSDPSSLYPGDPSFSITINDTSYTVGSYLYTSYTSSYWDPVYQGFVFFSSTWNSSTNLPWGGSENMFFCVVQKLNVYYDSSDQEYPGEGWSVYGSSQFGSMYEDPENPGMGDSNHVWENMSNSYNNRYYDDYLNAYSSDPYNSQESWHAELYVDTMGEGSVRNEVLLGTYFIPITPEGFYSMWESVSFGTGGTISSRYAYLNVISQVSSVRTTYQNSIVYTHYIDSYAYKHRGSPSAQSWTNGYEPDIFLGQFAPSLLESFQSNAPVASSDGTWAFERSLSNPDGKTSSATDNLRYSYSNGFLIGTTVHTEWELDQTPFTLRDVVVRADASTEIISSVSVEDNAFVPHTDTFYGRVVIGTYDNPEALVVTSDGVKVNGILDAQGISHDPSLAVCTQSGNESANVEAQTALGLKSDDGSVLSAVGLSGIVANALRGFGASGSADTFTSLTKYNSYGSVGSLGLFFLSTSGGYDASSGSYSMPHVGDLVQGSSLYPVCMAKYTLSDSSFYSNGDSSYETQSGTWALLSLPSSSGSGESMYSSYYYLVLAVRVL